MPNKSNWNITTIALVAGMLVTFATSVGAFYEVKSAVASQAESLSMLRRQHEECEVTNQRKWDSLSRTLEEMLARGVRNEVKIDAIIKLLTDELRERP